MIRLPLLLAALLALAPAAGLAAEPAGPPASMDELAIPSHGARLNGFIYRAAGGGAHPTVLFLHGYPGNERNLDLAQAVRRAGYNAIYIDYRGNWGSGGTFAPGNALEDVASALAWARDPSNAAKFGIDPEQLSLVGHSFGGWLTLMTASRDSGLRCAVAMAAWNLGWAADRFASHPDEEKALHDYIAWTGEDGGPMRLDAGAVMQALKANAADWNYLAHAAALKERPLLLVAATRDTPDEGVALHAQLAQAIRAAGGRRVEALVYDDDHPFSSHRLALGVALVEWLRKERCGGAPAKAH
jgi:dipeptidyl aminopeptidase/acylaminoacyl peptidase